MQLGVVGLGVMGANLARNAARNGAKVAVYNRTAEKTDVFVKEHGNEGQFVACTTLEELVAALEPPRPILIMVEAGKPVDAVIENLTPLLRGGDILIDGGNSHYRDTERRIEELERAGVRFIGMGVSGGAAGALEGPSMMPGGDESAWKELRPLLERMAADDGEGGRCVMYIGPGGSGHFVKTVHNGIEYAIMELIAESYDLLKSEGGKSNEELATIFEAWNEGEDLQSFLVEITAKIFRKLDGASTPPFDSPRSAGLAQGSAQHDTPFLIDLIRDAAGGKGTGKWAVEAAMEYGSAIPTIAAAVDARILSGSVVLRSKGKLFPETIEQPYPKPEKLTSRFRIALELSMICVYAQGFELMKVASDVEGWNLNLDDVARIWSGGCIIRSAFLRKRRTATKEEILSRFDGERQLDWRRIVAVGTGRGIPLPAMSASLAWYDALRRERLPQNLIQAQRDFFGAHGYERVDKKGVFHTEWE